MPLLTIIVPAYNAEAYLSRALDPLVALDLDFEVIIVDDGSSDRTAALAGEYVVASPQRFRLVSQPNKGHGGAVNTGIAEARGTYLKVLDADDWLAPDALAQVLGTLAALEEEGGVDACFTDYVHDRVGKANRFSRFDSVFPSGRLFGWDETARFGRRQYLMMHAIIYRTEVVRAASLRLPEHTFYVDNLYVVVPLRQVRRMCYLPVTLYHYFIGRADQSVNSDVMLRRVDQQLRVNKLSLKALPSAEEVVTEGIPLPLYDALLHYVEAVCAVTSATLARGGTREHIAQRNLFWQEIQEDNPWVYARMRRTILGTSSNLPGGAGRRVTSLAYRVVRRVVGFS